MSHKPLTEKITVFHLESTVSFRVAVSLVWHKSLWFPECNLLTPGLLMKIPHCIPILDKIRQHIHLIECMIMLDNVLKFHDRGYFFLYITSNERYMEKKKNLLAIHDLLTGGNQVPCSCSMCAGHDPHLYKYWRLWDESQNNLAGAGVPNGEGVWDRQIERKLTKPCLWAKYGKTITKWLYRHNVLSILHDWFIAIVYTIFYHLGSSTLLFFFFFLTNLFLAMSLNLFLCPLEHMMFIEPLEV